jgi:acyl phosphate:glycerol-3-phosphate acyltransferase
VIWTCILIAAAAYLLGSIPTGYLTGCAKGIDIRKEGSGNIGATNVFRTLGRTAGILVLVADGLKGWIAVALLPLLAPVGSDGPDGEYLRIIAGMAAILGHNYTIWLRFKGGKGIATSAGVLAGLVPISFVVSLGTWIIVCFLTRYVSVASIAAAVILPFATAAVGWIQPWGIQYSYRLVIITTAMAVLAIYKHKGNIQRLIQGTENRIGAKKSPPTNGAAA